MMNGDRDVADNEKINGWTVEDVSDASGPALILSKKGRGPLVVTYNEDMDRDVLMEYATTRILEAEINDAGDKVPDQLQEKYDRHVEDSRDNQLTRETKRRRAEQRK